MLDILDAKTPVVLISGEIPDDFGSVEIDTRVKACIEKDDLSAERLYKLLSSFDLPLAS